MRPILLSRATLAIAAAAAPCLLGGCTVENRTAPPPDGSVTVDWTIADAKDPGDCANYGADTLELVITSAGGANVGTWDAACGDFATQVSLPPGDYSATATLIDSQGRSRSSTIDIHPFSIDSDTDLNIPIDFPTSSFT
jgi:hypothetical protein